MQEWITIATMAGHYKNLYFNSNVNSFTPSTTPNTNMYNNVATNISITNISNQGNVMSVDIEGL